MKKTISILLALVMVFSMATVAFAAEAFPDYSQSDISKSSADLIRIGYDRAGELGAIRTYKMTDTLDVLNDVQAAKSWLVIHEDGSSSAPYIYIWAANNKTDKKFNQKVSESLADDWNMAIEVTDKTGPVKNVFIDSDSRGNAVIAFELEPYLNSVSAQSFTVSGYIKAGSRKIRNTEFTIRGTYENRAQVIDEEDDNEIDMSEGSEYMLKLDATVRDARIELRNGMYVEMPRLTKGKNIYLRADTSISDSDIEMMEKFDLDNVIRVYSVNAKADTTKVVFPDYDYYVYTLDPSSKAKTGKDVTFKYLGESSDELPLVDVYFLTRSSLDINYEEPDYDDDDDIDYSSDIELPPLFDNDFNFDNPNGGGNSGNANVNYNPSTGC